MKEQSNLLDLQLKVLFEHQNWKIAFSAERTKSYQSMFFLALVQGASDSLKTKKSEQATALLLEEQKK